MAASSASSWMPGTHTVVNRLASAGLSSFLPKSPPGNCSARCQPFRHIVSSERKTISGTSTANSDLTEGLDFRACLEDLCDC